MCSGGRRSRRSSTLNVNLSHSARTKPSPTAEKTEKFRTALTPNPGAIATPNAIKRIPVTRAAARVCASNHERDRKKSQHPKFPEATFGCPKATQMVEVTGWPQSAMSLGDTLNDERVPRPPSCLGHPVPQGEGCSPIVDPSTFSHGARGRVIIGFTLNCCAHSEL